MSTTDEKRETLKAARTQHYAAQTRLKTAESKHQSARDAYLANPTPDTAREQDRTAAARDRAQANADDRLARLQAANAATKARATAAYNDAVDRVNHQLATDATARAAEARLDAIAQSAFNAARAIASPATARKEAYNALIAAGAEHTRAQAAADRANRAYGEAVTQPAIAAALQEATGSRLEYDQTTLNVWEERDRLHIELSDARTDTTIAEWWDDDARQAIEDGWLNPRNLHTTAYEYAGHLGLLPAADETQEQEEAQQEQAAAPYTTATQPLSPLYTEETMHPYQPAGGYTAASKMIDTAETRATQAAHDADAAAGKAEEHRHYAEQAATEAAESNAQAAAHANKAEQSELAAQDAEQEVSELHRRTTDRANEAEEEADRARRYSEEAAESAEESADYARDATTRARESDEAADRAHGYAAEALAHAHTAEDNAALAINQADAAEAARNEARLYRDEAATILQQIRSLAGNGSPTPAAAAPAYYGSPADDAAIRAAVWAYEVADNEGQEPYEKDDAARNAAIDTGLDPTRASALEASITAYAQARETGSGFHVAAATALETYHATPDDDDWTAPDHAPGEGPDAAQADARIQQIEADAVQAALITRYQQAAQDAEQSLTYAARQIAYETDETTAGQRAYHRAELARSARDADAARTAYTQARQLAGQ